MQECLGVILKKDEWAQSRVSHFWRFQFVIQERITEKLFWLRDNVKCQFGIKISLKNNFMQIVSKFLYLLYLTFFFQFLCLWYYWHICNKKNYRIEIEVIVWTTWIYELQLQKMARFAQGIAKKIAHCSITALQF